MYPFESVCVYTCVHSFSVIKGISLRIQAVFKRHICFIPIFFRSQAALFFFFLREIRYFMTLPTKPSKLFHTKIIIKSKPQGSFDIQERLFLPPAKTSIQKRSETQTNTSSVSKRMFTGNKNDKTAVSF